MYKVFFNDRKLFLTDDFTKHFQVKYGLFYKYRDVDDLKELIAFYNKLTRIESLYLFHKDIEELRKAFRQCFVPIEAGGGLVRNEKGEYLLIHRRGRWDLPKGKMDKGETIEETALREVQEECGITDLTIYKPLLSTYHTYNYKEGIALKRTTWFEMHYKGCETPIPQEKEQIDEVRWVPVKELGTYLDDSFPAIRDVFTYFGV